MKRKWKWGIADQMYLHLSGNLTSACILLSPKSCSADCHLPLTAGASIISQKTSHCMVFELLFSLSQQRAGFVQREGGVISALAQWLGHSWHREQGLPLTPGRCQDSVMQLRHFCSTQGKQEAAGKAEHRVLCSPGWSCCWLRCTSQLRFDSLLGHWCSSITKP